MMVSRDKQYVIFMNFDEKMLDILQYKKAGEYMKPFTCFSTYS